MRLALLVAAAFVLSPSLSAHANTVNFGSFVGSSAPGFSNGVITFSNTMGSGSVVANPNGAYATAYSGTQFVSYTSSSNAPANYTTDYTTSYTGNLAGDSGSLSLLVDNDATVYLNGFLLGTGSSYTTTSTFTIASTDFVNGVNTFTFDVLNDNTGGPTAFDFSASATTSATPEPSSFALLGTGLAGIAGVVKRRYA